MPMYKSEVITEYFILTGAMGAGKSTILEQLTKFGIATINEPAREIIAEQRAIDGDGIYDRDPRLFYNLMLSRAIFQWKLHKETSAPIIWDRGIADNIVYAKLFSENPAAAENASKVFRYNQDVFFLNAWEEIYKNDEERKMSFLDAKSFGDQVKDTYIALGYNIIEVPFDDAQARVQYIVDRLK